MLVVELEAMRSEWPLNGGRGDRCADWPIESEPDAGPIKMRSRAQTQMRREMMMERRPVPRWQHCPPPLSPSRPAPQSVPHWKEKLARVISAGMLQHAPRGRPQETIWKTDAWVSNDTRRRRRRRRRREDKEEGR